MVRIFMLSLICFMMVGVIFTKSRGGFIGFVAIGLGLIFFSKNRVATFLVMMIAFLVLAVLAGPEYLTHMSTITDGIHGSRSSEDRYIGLRNGIEMMIKRPILGVGIGCYAVARRQYFNYYFYSHNLYGELFGELGLASLAWFYWIYAVFKKTRKLKQGINPDNDKVKLYYNILTGVQLGLFLRLVLGSFSHSAFIWFWFLMAGLTLNMEELVKKK